MLYEHITIYILPIGDLELKHQVPYWNHELEDILIQSINEGSNDYIKLSYNDISIDAVKKALELGLNTCCKSPLCISMAFSDNPSSLSGFYKEITAKRYEIITKVLEKTGFTKTFHKFLE